MAPPRQRRRPRPRRVGLDPHFPPPPPPHTSRPPTPPSRPHEDPTGYRAPLLEPPVARRAACLPRRERHDVLGHGVGWGRTLALALAPRSRPVIQDRRWIPARRFVVLPSTSVVVADRGVRDAGPKPSADSRNPAGEILARWVLERGGGDGVRVVGHGGPDLSVVRVDIERGLQREQIIEVVDTIIIIILHVTILITIHDVPDDTPIRRDYPCARRDSP